VKIIQWKPFADVVAEDDPLRHEAVVITSGFFGTLVMTAHDKTLYWIHDGRWNKGYVVDL
jgi:hypothetical protein